MSDLRVNPLRLKEVTISVTFSDKEYGKGTESFQCLKAEYPAPVEFSEVNNVIDDSLDLFFSAWKTMLGTRFATGVIDAASFKKTLQDSELRIEMVRKYLSHSVIS
jgi:hypothetical protein